MSDANSELPFEPECDMEGLRNDNLDEDDEGVDGEEGTDSQPGLNTHPSTANHTLHSPTTPSGWSDIIHPS